MTTDPIHFLVSFWTSIKKRTAAALASKRYCGTWNVRNPGKLVVFLLNVHPDNVICGFLTANHPAVQSGRNEDRIRPCLWPQQGLGKRWFTGFGMGVRRHVAKLWTWVKTRDLGWPPKMNRIQVNLPGFGALGFDSQPFELAAKNKTKERVAPAKIW